jgi:4-alpha-glucanotransferase
VNPERMISSAYIDGLGNERIVPEATRTAFAAALAQTQNERFAPATLVVREGEELTFDLLLPARMWEANVLWTLRSGRRAQAGTFRLQDAPVVEVEHRPNGTYDTRRATLPLRPPLGEYRLTLDIVEAGHAGIDVLVCPHRAHLEGAPRQSWGLAIQLYTLRSERNWGIGDFSDLDAFCRLAAQVGARYVGINPLHAAHRSDPEAASPYAPTSRRYLNWLAIDVEAVPEAMQPEVQAFITTLAHDIAVARATPMVDYTRVARLKDAALRRAHASLAGARATAFAGFVAESGPALERFATFEALTARFGRDLAQWPVEMRSPDAPAVAAFAAGEGRAEISYGMYLQWCAAQQFAAVADRARAAGVLLYRDLAVGIEANAAEAWSEPEYVRTASIGAPADLLNTTGQDWGLPPLSPTALTRDAYRGFAGVLADNMRHAGALRIDHAMGLRRLFWIPAGEKPTAGAYVEYPFEDLLGVLARESQRAECVTVGEDLGTVPDGFRERMAAANVLSYRILLFERSWNGTYLAPHHYPDLALATAGTHDLPPLAGWLRGEDIDLRVRLGLLAKDALDAERAQRARDRELLETALREHADLPAGADERAIIVAAYRYLAQTPARIVMVQIEDLLGETVPVNVPGTHAEYPNWRRKLSSTLTQLANDLHFAQFAKYMRELRPSMESLPHI